MSINSSQQIISAIYKIKISKSTPIVVAIDGGSGSGKSSLAQYISNELDAGLIQLDDFFSEQIPEHTWDTFSVSERYENVFNWYRVRNEILEPLISRKSASWFAFDFESGLRPDGTFGMQTEPKTCSPTDVIILEGAYSASPFLADLIDLSILVDVPVSIRHERLSIREDDDFLNGWHDIWDDVEEYYFTNIRPDNSFDLVIDNIVNS